MTSGQERFDGTHVDECNSRHVIAEFRLGQLEESFRALQTNQHRIILLLFGNLVGIIMLLATKVSQMMAAH